MIKLKRRPANICPHCGKNTTIIVKNYSREIISLLNMFNDITRKEIERVRDLIIKYDKVARLRQDLFYRFLNNISQVDQDVIIDSITYFINKDLHETKPFSYLSAIIHNNVKLRDKLIENEILNHGRPPKMTSWN